MGAGGAACDHLEGFSDSLLLGLLRNHGATCTVTTSQPWWDAVVRSLFLLNPSVTLDLILISLMTSKAGGGNSTNAHCCSCKKMHALMGAHTDTPRCILKYTQAHTHGDRCTHKVKRPKAALLRSRVVILLSTVSARTFWLADALLCCSSRRYRVVEDNES